MIDVRDLVASYDGRQVLDGVSMTVGDGEWVLLVGRNGSGKTTLVRHFNALLEPDAGAVLVDDRPAAADPVATRTSVGMVFQHPRDQFVAATVGADVAFGPENLGLERAEIDRRVADALDAVGLAGREDERIDALSGGEQARVAIAGALAMEPTHLVLDEPLVSLDESARQSVLATLDEVNAGGTSVVLVTHDLRDLLERADRVVGLADGRAVVDASPAEAVEDLPGIGVKVPEC